VLRRIQLANGKYLKNCEDRRRLAGRTALKLLGCPALRARRGEFTRHVGTNRP